ncbi:unnamed protein product [Linum trigynum]|uniref:Uncharacterized protein n=1 Tax=Linum trigynum TaxID=586398 RepID=A0AAV2E3A6_9ROSI
MYSSNFLSGMPYDDVVGVAASSCLAIIVLWFIQHDMTKLHRHNISKNLIYICPDLNSQDTCSATKTKALSIDNCIKKG